VRLRRQGLSQGGPPQAQTQAAERGRGVQRAVKRARRGRRRARQRARAAAATGAVASSHRAVRSSERPGRQETGACARMGRGPRRAAAGALAPDLVPSERQRRRGRERAARHSR
jgi:hypothetical protein